MSTALWGSSGGHHQDRLDRTIWASWRIEVPGEGCTSLPMLQTKITEAGGYAQISDYYLHIWYICWALVGCPGVSKNKTLNSGIILVVFFSCFKKFKCLGDVLDSVTPITVRHIEVPSFGRFYNLAQVLIWHSIFLAQWKLWMWSNISFSMSAVTKKGSA